MITSQKKSFCMHLAAHTNGILLSSCKRNHGLVWKVKLHLSFYQRESPPAGNRKRRITRGITCPSISYPRWVSTLAWGVPTLTWGTYLGVPLPPSWPGYGVPPWMGGYLPWGTPPLFWPSRGYLPWMGVPTLGYPLPCPDLDGGYLPWIWVPTLGYPLPLSWPGLGGTYLGWGTYLGVPLPLWQTDWCLWKHCLPVVLHMRAVISKSDKSVRFDRNTMQFLRTITT